LDVELAEEHDSFLSKDSSNRRVWFVNTGSGRISLSAMEWANSNSPFMDFQNTSSATKPIIEAAEVDRADPELTEGRSAHDTWFDGDV
jgi:hypothetical protein